MANVKIFKDTVYVASAVKLGDILKLEKYRPAALTLKEGEGDKAVPVFRVCTGKSATIDANGAVFDRTKDKDKPAEVSLVYTGDGDIKEYVKDKLGLALVRLNKLEGLISAALGDVDADRAALDAMIEVIG